MTGSPPTVRRDCRRVFIRAFRIALFALIAASISGAGRSYGQGTSVRVESFTLRPGGQVKIENSRGSTRVEVWEGDSVRVVAEKKQPAGSPLEPTDMVLMGAGDTVVIECRQASQSGRIDLAVYVPVDTNLELTGGAFPVEVDGRLGSAVVESTSGSIDYKLAKTDDSHITLRSARGVVRSLVPLTSSTRAGVGTLQGLIGIGTSPIVINSQSGNITLGVSNSLPVASRAPEPGSQRQMTGAAARRDPAPEASNTSRATRQEPPAFDRGVARQGGDRDDAADSDRNSIAVPPSRRPQGSSSASRNGGNMVVFAQDSHDDDSHETVRSGGPFTHPRKQTDAGGGTMGLRVRIIPANKPLGAPGDSQNSIYDDPDAPDSKGNKTDSDSSRDNASPDVDTSRNPQSSGGGLAGSNRGYDSQRRADSYPRGSSAREDVDSSTDFGGAVSRTGPPTLRRSADQGAGGADESAEPGSTRQPADEESIVLNSSLVNLHVTVFNRSGAAIGNLKKEDFKVYENNQPQEVDFFAPTSAPFNLVLLLDLSGSIQDKLDVVKSAALKFLDVIGPQDKVAVVTFTNEIRVISQLSSNRDLVRKRIKEIDRSDGGTAFYEAMWFSLMDTLKGMRGQRNAIVVMTDGVDSSLDRFSPAPSRVSFNQLARRLEETDVIVFPIYMDTEFEEVFKRGRNTSEAYAIARSQLERIAELTGGRMYQAEQVNDLSGVYKQVGAALRTVYSVGYYSTKPERDGTYRRVRISVGKPDAAVRTRRGYYAK